MTIKGHKKASEIVIYPLTNIQQHSTTPQIPEAKPSSGMVLWLFVRVNKFTIKK